MTLNKKVLVIYRDLPETAPYAEAMAAVGAEPVLVQARDGLSIGEYSGLLLTGGGDVNPARYGEAIRPETDAPDDERDTVESDLIDQALQQDVPLFAICRGLQILNVHLGGTLEQHLDLIDRHQTGSKLPAHDVTIEPGTLLARVAGQSRWNVNSRHHQAVIRVGTGLKVCATDPIDGTIEALEQPDRKFVLAVQWHPEDQALTDPEQIKLFRAFAAAL